MARSGWTIIAGACIMGTFAFVPPGKHPGTRMHDVSRMDTVRTTQSGVFTDEQAKRGKETYAGICLSCHAPSSQTGDEFDQHWKDHPLSDLYAYISTQMPQNDPGTLDPNVTADIVAYLLQLNTMPAGTAELLPDTAALKNIRITRIKGPTP